jgi:hypothetical protein
MARSKERQDEIDAMDVLERVMAKVDDLPEPYRGRVRSWLMAEYFATAVQGVTATGFGVMDARGGNDVSSWPEVGAVSNAEEPRIDKPARGGSKA